MEEVERKRFMRVMQSTKTMIFFATLAIILSFASTLGGQAAPLPGRAETKQSQTAKEHLEQARQAIKKRDFRLAKSELKQARAINNSVAETYFLLAQISYEEKNREEAQRFAREAIKRQPSYRDAHYLLARLSFETNDRLRAREELDQAIAQGASFVKLYQLAGDLDVVDQKYKGAIAAYQEALDLTTAGDPGIPLLQQQIEDLKNFLEFCEHRGDPAYKQPSLRGRMPRPEYTEWARGKRIGGTVRVAALINETGTVRSTFVVSGLGYGLDEKAVEAVRKVELAPATKYGKPVPFWLIIEVSFKIL